MFKVFISGYQNTNQKSLENILRNIWPFFNFPIEQDIAQLIDDPDMLVFVADERIKKELSGKFRHPAIYLLSNNDLKNKNPEKTNLIHKTFVKHVHSMQQRFIERIKNNQLLDTLLHDLHDSFSLVSPDGLILYNSPNNYNLFGRQPEENEGDNAFMHVHPDDLEITKKGWQNMLENPGQSIRQKFRYRHKLGHWLTLEGNGRFIVTSENYPLCIISFSDLTEVEKTNRLLDNVFNAVPVGLLLFDEKGTLVKYNKKACELLHCSHKQINSMNIRDSLFLQIGLPLYEYMKEHSWEWFWKEKQQYFKITKNSKIDSLPGYTLVQIEDISQQKWGSHLKKFIYEYLFSLTGQDFFNETVKFITSKLHFKYALVGIYNSEAICVDTVAFAKKGKISKNFTYDLQHTPCMNVIGQEEIVFIEKDFAKSYPLDEMAQKLSLESYLGIPLFNDEGGKTGLLAMFHDKPITDDTLHYFQDWIYLLTNKLQSELNRWIVQKKLAQTHTLTKTLLNSVDAGFLLLDENKKNIISNNAFKTFSGLIANDDLNIFSGEFYLKLRNSVRFKQLKKIIDTSHENKKIKSVSIEIPAKENRNLKFLFKVYPYNQQLSGTLIEIIRQDEKEWLQTQMEISQKLLKFIFSRTDTILFIFDDKGRIIEWQFPKSNIPGKKLLSRYKTIFDLLSIEEQVSKKDILTHIKKTSEIHLHDVKKEFWFRIEVIPIITNPTNKETKWYGVLFDITDQKLSEKMLQQAVIQAQEEEKKQLAMELHDNLGQILAATNIQVSLLNQKLTSKEKQKEAKYIEQLIKTAIDITRKTSHQLMPQELTHLPFDQILQNLVKMFESPDLKIKISIGKSIVELIQDNRIKLNLYRIIQELLHNTVKHSGAKKANIKLRSEDHFLILEYSDDGKGFDMKNIKEGIGLKNIRLRSLSLGGDFKITSGRGKGFQFRLMFNTKTYNYEQN
jgi:PAS domain S-box-containing protein